MWRRCAAGLLVGVLLARAAPASGEEAVPAKPAQAAIPAQPVAEKGAGQVWDLPPEVMQVLNLTGLQLRLLGQVFHQYAYETPPPPKADAAFGVKVDASVPGGLYRMGSGGDLPVRLVVSVRSTGTPSAVSLRYLAQDFYGRKVASGTLPPVYPDKFGMAAADLILKELSAFGYYHVLVTATREGRSVTGWCGVAVVHPLPEGPDPKSPFGLVAPPGKMSADVPPVCRRLGVGHLAFDWTGDEAAARAAVKAGLVPSAIVGLEIPQRSPAADDFSSTMSDAIARRVETVADWQIGRRPVFGPGALAEAAASYRQAISGLIQAVRRRETPARLWVAASPDALAGVLTEGPVLAGADGVSLYVDAGAREANLRSGAYRRSLDYGIQVARRLGIERTVVGTGDDPSVHLPQRQAWKLVTRHVVSLAAGAERVYVSWGRGLPTPVSSAAAYAWMTHLLDGAIYEGDAWAGVPLIEAHLFSGPERRAAVVWSWVGTDPQAPDRGLLVFDDGLGLEALDVAGQPVAIWKGRQLIVPFGEAPVYLVSGELSVGRMRERLRKARILGVGPATVRIESIVRGGIPGKANVTLWIQSHRPHKQEAVAGLLLPEGWRARQGKRRFQLEAGQAREVTFECDVAADAGRGPYAIEAVVSLDEQYVRCSQNVWAAQTVERTIKVGYGLADWEGIEPVVLEDAGGDVWAEVRTAWDKEFFYFSAAVRRKRATFKAGTHAFGGDAVQLAWGLSRRADDDFGHKTKDWALPAGAFRDTDHLMALTFGRDGAAVVRLRAPRVALRTHWPGNQDGWYGPVEGAVADIARDQAIGYTLFEAAIPMKELAPLKGARGRIFRFGFRIGNGDGRPLEWSRTAGVPDYLANPCSFLPASLADGLPCQTWWGMTGEKQQ